MRKLLIGETADDISKLHNHRRFGRPGRKCLFLSHEVANFEELAPIRRDVCCFQYCPGKSRCRLLDERIEPNVKTRGQLDPNVAIEVLRSRAQADGCA